MGKHLFRLNCKPPLQHIGLTTTNATLKVSCEASPALKDGACGERAGQIYQPPIERFY
jgi:hypothetical protein